VAGGLDETALLRHAAHVRAIGERLSGIRLLVGVECDILPDGTLDLSDDCLAQLDLVVASVHSGFTLDSDRMTDRILRAIESPWVDILGHPTGRLLLRRDAYAVDIERVIDAAARHSVALEISGQIERLDLNDVHARLARDRGAALVVNSDSHSTGGFRLLQWGVMVARRAWLRREDLLNTRPVEQFLAGLRRNRRGQA
jgi:DNA polymerase (family 10)